MNFAINPSQRNFQNFRDHISANAIFEIIFSYEFETDDEEGMALRVWLPMLIS
jgi:hypothetical protein